MNWKDVAYAVWYLALAVLWIWGMFAVASDLRWDAKLRKLRQLRSNFRFLPPSQRKQANESE